MQLGLIGLGTMGANLARNAARNGAKVSVFNRTPERTASFMNAHAKEGDFSAFEDIASFVDSLEKPRAVLVMVKAGEAVDEVVAELLPHLSKDDIVIDGGNSHYDDTQRRFDSLAEKGIRFLGMGVSGGEDGALHGPSLMPGGDQSAYEHIRPLLTEMAADDGEGGKCVAFIGSGGSGHFVKMAHNGIEYGVMQLIAESYDFLKNVGGLTNAELADTYHAWNDASVLRSYLIQITADIFRTESDVPGVDLIDLVQDTAEQKGTGKWTTQSAVELGVAVPTINAAVDARILSASTVRRARRNAYARHIDSQETTPAKMKLVSQMRSALKQSVICAYNQGFELMDTATEHFGWGIDSGEVARIWKGGCIIRSDILTDMASLYSSDRRTASAGTESLLDRFAAERQSDWRRVIALAALKGVTLPAMSASLAYYDSYTRKRLPQNLIQAQRDSFGAHTYRRIDKEGSFHSNWTDASNG